MKMNKFLMATAAVAVFMGSVLTYTVARADDDDLVTEALIVVAMTVDCVTPGFELNFGDIGASVAGGTVDIDTANGITHTGVADLGGTQTSGVCDVTGDTTRAYGITLAATDLTGPGADMTLTNLVIDNVNGNIAGVGPYTASLVAGADTLSIGGTLNVGANQVAGLYNGTVNVTVDYQ